jgi:hypothetical protein
MPNDTLTTSHTTMAEIDIHRNEDTITALQCCLMVFLMHPALALQWYFWPTSRTWEMHFIASRGYHYLQSLPLIWQTKACPLP